MKFMTNYCGPVKSIKFTKLLGLFCLRSLPCISREKNTKESISPAVSAQPFLWIAMNVCGLEFSFGSIRVFWCLVFCFAFFFLNEHLSFMILFRRPHPPKKKRLFEKFGSDGVWNVVVNESVFCVQAVSSSIEKLIFFFNSRQISISVLRWKCCHLNILKCLNSEVKNKNPDTNCISIIAWKGNSVSEVKKLVLVIDLELHFCAVNTWLNAFKELSF